LAVKLKKSDELINQLRKEIEDLRSKERELGELRERYSTEVQIIGRRSVRMSVDTLRSPARDSRASIFNEPEPLETRARLRDLEQKNQKLEQTLAQLADHNTMKNIAKELEMKYRSLIESLESKLREAGGPPRGSSYVSSEEPNALNLIEKRLLVKEISNQDEKIKHLRDELSNTNAMLSSVLVQSIGESSGT
jgi:DNA repair exonuclease SbcCD ATPase subunit